MGLPVYQLREFGALEVTKQHMLPRCSLCELVLIIVEMERIMRGMEITTDLRAYQRLARGILLVAKQQSHLQLSATVKQMRILRDILVSEKSFPERLIAARQAVCEVQRTSSSSRCSWEQIAVEGVLLNLRAGAKRGLSETEMLPQHFIDYCCPPSTEGPSKRCKHSGHLVHITEIKCQGKSGGGCRNPNRGDVNGEEYYNLIHESSVSNCDRDQYICKDIIEGGTPMSSLDSAPSNEVCNSLASGILSPLLDALGNMPGRRWLSKKKRTVSIQRKRVEVPKETTAGTGWDSLPGHLQENILQKVEFKDLFRFKIVSRPCKEYIESDAFRLWRGANSSQEGLFTAINYYIKDEAWRCSGFDLNSRIWRTLPPFLYLPPPDAELFKEFSISGNAALMCADVSKLPQKGQLVVFNPLTGKKRELPPLLYPRNPVLVHMSVDSPTKSFKVIVAGSSTASDEHLSKKMEVFDSKTSQWEETNDLPGPAFGLNEHQAGVCLNGVLYFISFLEGSGRRGVVAFDVENRKWLEDMACPIPFSMYSNTLQLVESNGEVYLFSEQERGGSVEHCIDLLEFPNPKAGAAAMPNPKAVAAAMPNPKAGAVEKPTPKAAAVERRQWRNVVRLKKAGGRGLQVYPEHTCVAFGEGKLCIFNTLSRDGVVFDMQDGRQCEVLEAPPPEQKGENFFSLNPASFTLQPSFDSDPTTPTVDLAI